MSGLNKICPIAGNFQTTEPKGQGEAGVEVGAQSLLDLRIINQDNVDSVNELFIPLTIQGIRLLLLFDTGSHTKILSPHQLSRIPGRDSFEYIPCGYCILQADGCNHATIHGSRTRYLPCEFTHYHMVSFMIEDTLMFCAE